jgi:hypothetical protein
MQSEIEFLENHRNADVIVVNERTGEVVRAEYLRLHGIERKYPAIYYWPEY